jgi:hypothetical protein
MTAPVEPWGNILDAARNYPSPHNSQPIRVRVESPTTAQVFYDLDRGLPAENFGIPFGHVCAGVFLESLAVVAASEGFRVSETLYPEPMNFAATERLHHIATVSLTQQDPTDRDVERRAAYDHRRTNRRPYDSRTVPDADLAAVRALASARGHVFADSTDAAVVREIIEVNQSTLFDDLRNDAVYAEIMTWLRFSREHAKEAGDGLSAEAMLMPGALLKFAMGHRGMWDGPIVGAAVRGMYLRTMRGVSHVAWFEGPFATETDYVEAGRLFMRCWLELTARGISLHPLGTVITNPRSHARFVEAAGISESAPNMAWMLVRLGYAKTPPVAYRRGIDELVVT